MLDKRPATTAVVERLHMNEAFSLTDYDLGFVLRVSHVLKTAGFPASQAPKAFYQLVMCHPRRKYIGWRVAKAGGFWACVHKARNELEHDEDRRYRRQLNSHIKHEARKRVGICAYCLEKPIRPGGTAACADCTAARRPGGMYYRPK